MVLKRRDLSDLPATGELEPRPDYKALFFKAVEHSQAERWDEAARIYAELIVDPNCPIDPISLQNNTAWAVAHCTEEPEASIKLAEEALSDAIADAHPKLIPYCHGTLGTALALHGDAARGLKFLDAALGFGGEPPVQCIRHYYRGVALARLGKHDEAKAAWRTAIDTDPDSKWAKKADERLTATSSP